MEGRGQWRGGDPRAGRKKGQSQRAGQGEPGEKGEWSMGGEGGIGKAFERTEEHAAGDERAGTPLRDGGEKKGK